MEIPHIWQGDLYIETGHRIAHQHSSPVFIKTLPTHPVNPPGGSVSQYRISLQNSPKHKSPPNSFICNIHFIVIAFRNFAQIRQFAAVLYSKFRSDLITKKCVVLKRDVVRFVLKVSSKWIYYIATASHSLNIHIVERSLHVYRLFLVMLCAYCTG